MFKSHMPLLVNELIVHATCFSRWFLTYSPTLVFYIPLCFSEGMDFGVRSTVKLLVQRIRNHNYILKNSLWLISSEVVAKLVLFGVVILLARHLGAEGYGQLQFALSFAGVFGMAMDLGMNSVAVRELSRVRERFSVFVPNVIFLKLVLFVASLFVMYVFLIAVGKPPQIIVLSLMACCYYLFYSLIEFVRCVYQAFEKMYLQAFSRMFYCLLLGAGVVFLVFKNVGVVAIMAGYVFAIAATFVFSFIVLSYKIGTFPFKIDAVFIKQLLKVVFPFTLIAVIAIINLRIDTIMLSFMLDDKAVGIYSVAASLLTAVMFVPSYFSASLSPSLNRLFKSDVRKLMVMFKSVFWLMLLLGAAGGLVLFFVSKPVLVLLFGVEYAASVPVLQIFSASFFLSFVSFIVGSICVVIDRQVFYAKVIAVSVLINIVLNYLFVKSIGISGAAVATTFAQAFQIVVIFFFLKRRGFFFVAPVPKEAKLR